MLKTTLLLGLLTGIILWFGQFFGGTNGLVVSFALAVLMNFGSYWFSDKLVLRMYGAQPVEMNDAPELYRIVQNLATRAGIPMPKLYVIPSDGANAFATGRSPQHAAVAVTQGITRLMSAEELEAVLAHEISHVVHRDILISSIAATLAGVVMMLARTAQFAAMFGGGSRDDRDDRGGALGLLVTAIFAPLAAMLIQMAVSRAREFEADAGAARLLHGGEKLASALEKLAYSAQRVPVDASPQTAHMFIVNPLTGSAFANLFSTHPPLEERIRRLRSMPVA